ncbi:mitochondrial outer membrane import complex protein METAXIN [Vigna radiata var. radiata]|uniref:Mitochondrial outer membrane import complex protein METAXIN n=1 Tax=Vigna radiata var. radiata TaxID=3916 RepID=A0A1S3TG57_VIGRR|nr:mitochondrial outer membrane import complex protein METAXIN [Vigna radiata var. radiata]
MATVANESTRMNTLVVRKPCFGLPTGCPQCLSAYIFLKFSQVPFNLDYHPNYPDSDQIPYFESGDCVAYNNEKEGIIESLKREVGDLDSGISSLPDWTATKVLLTTWLADALEYELWVGCNGSSVDKIYYSDLPWPIGRLLYWKKALWVMQKHGISKDNAEKKEEEIYGRANSAYDALSTLLGEQNYLFENRPSSLDAIFLAHALVILQALPESSILRVNFLEHTILVKYVQQCNTKIIETSALPSNYPDFHAEPSSSSSDSKGRSTSGSTKPKTKPKRQPQTKEEKTFRRRAKYFVVAQLVAVILFLSIRSGSGDDALELDDVGYDFDE